MTVWVQRLRVFNGHLTNNEFSAGKRILQEYQESIDLFIKFHYVKYKEPVSGNTSPVMNNKDFMEGIFNTMEDENEEVVRFSFDVDCLRCVGVCLAAGGRGVWTCLV
jgi:hypothetical protein